MTALKSKKIKIILWGIILVSAAILLNAAWYHIKINPA